MADTQTTLTIRLKRAVVAAFGDAYDDVDPLIRPTGQPQFGDYQANVAMGLAKQLGESPRDIAAKIVEHLDVGNVCGKVEVAGPGFINLFLSDAYLNDRLNMMARDERLGVPAAEQTGGPRTVVIDYSSPNVAKEMHVGHLRSTIIGDCIARVLEFQGHRVIRQNHLGDWGTQFGHVMFGLWYEAAARNDNASDDLQRWIDEARTVPKQGKDEPESDAVKRRAAEKKLLDEIVPRQIRWYKLDPNGDVYFQKYLDHCFPDLQRLQELYAFSTTITSFESSDQYTIPMLVGGDRTLAQLPSYIATYVQQQHLEKNRPERTAWIRCREVSLRACGVIYERLDVKLMPDDVRGESYYQDRLEGVIEALAKSGKLEESQGAQVVFPSGFTNKDGEPLPLIVRKSDGGYLYATTDLAAIRYRIGDLKADRVIYVTDARQSQHFDMVFSTARMVGWALPSVALEHVPFGTVLGKDKKPLKTRDGGTVRLIDLLEEAERRAAAIIEQKEADLSADERARVAHVVGIGALKYADLSTDRIKDYVFDWDRMLAFEGNTAPYIQNAYVRVHGIFRKGEVAPATLGDKTIIVTQDAERVLAVKLLQLPSVADAVSRSLEPHRLCTYLYELAAAYHKFFETCPVLSAEDDAARLSRLRLCDLVQRTFKTGLGLLGIGVVERM